MTVSAGNRIESRKKVFHLRLNGDELNKNSGVEKKSLNTLNIYPDQFGSLILTFFRNQRSKREEKLIFVFILFFLLVEMGNSLCKERIARADNSKSPIDRIIGRCAQVNIFHFCSKSDDLL